MLIHWMLHCVVVAALLGVAALMAERVLRGVGRQGRWVWAAALLGSLMIPLAAWRGWVAGAGWLGWSVRSLVGGWSLRRWTAAEPGTSAVPDPGVGAETMVLDALRSAAVPDGFLLYGWLLSTVVGAVVLLLASWRLIRARNSWPSAEVDGVRVLVSREVGPAALGVLRGAIVLPAWVLGLEAGARRLILRHEVEHLRAGDPRLLFAALLVVVLMPWNPVIWWQFRRLRQSLELDCDSRVLRAEPDVRSYGLVLLEVGRRRGGGVLVMAGMASSHSFLERRLKMLGRTSFGLSRARIWGGAAMAAFLVFLACEAHEPVAVEEDAVRSAELEGSLAGEFLSLTPQMTRPEIKNRREIEALLVSSYPASLRAAGIGGTVDIKFMIDETGRVVRHEAMSSSGHEELDQAALRVAAAMKFSPAMNHGQRVGVQVVFPITFRVS